MLLPKRRTLPDASLCRAFGVTRIARITGLDRTGIEVACAVRPEGHVLQVSNGKGRTFEHAAATALSEAAELSAAEHPDTRSFRYASFNALKKDGAVWPDPTIAGESRDLVIAWTSATELTSGRRGWLPAQFIHCPPPGAFLGPAIFRWTSNGLAAHPKRTEAIRHALREISERDALAKSLPQGWTAKLIRSRRVKAPTSLSPRIAQLQERGFEVALFDLRSSPRAAPVAGALLFDADEGPIPMTAGYACSSTMNAALESALFEAAQSRLTDIHGAREDVSPANRDEAAQLREICRSASEKRLNDSAPTNELASLLGGREAWIVDLVDGPLKVVRAVIPGLRVSELL